MSEGRTTAQTRDAARAWQLMAHFVIDHRGPWRKAMMARTGLPFNHFRLLRRIGSGAVTIGDLAAAATIDAPAATVGVNELEKRGLAERTVDPTNRRRKLVSLTDSGHAVLADAMTTDDPAPSAFDALGDDEIAELVRLIAKLDTTAHGRGQVGPLET